MLPQASHWLPCVAFVWKTLHWKQHNSNVVLKRHTVYETLVKKIPIRVKLHHMHNFVRYSTDDKSFEWWLGIVDFHWASCQSSGPGWGMAEWKNYNAKVLKTELARGLLGWSLNFVGIKNPSRSFQTNLRDNVWWVPAIFFVEKHDLLNTLL